MKTLLFTSVVLTVANGFAAAADRPNFLLIFTDDHGYGDVSTYHASDVRTPNIDRLAAEGMLFTTMRANCTVCSPSRAALLTGRYADRVGVPGVIRTHPEDSWGYFDPGVPTLADELKKAGYHTAIVGKWHLGLESPNTPNERGFDFFHGFLGDMMDSYTTHLRHGNNYLRRNAEVDRAGGPCHRSVLRLGRRVPARAGKAPRPAVLPVPRLQRAAFSHRAAGRMAGEGAASGRRRWTRSGRRTSPSSSISTTASAACWPRLQEAGLEQNTLVVVHRRQRRLAAARAEQRSVARRQAEPLRRRPARAVHGPLAGPHPARLAQRLRGAELRPVPHLPGTGRRNTRRGSRRGEPRARAARAARSRRRAICTSCAAKAARPTAARATRPSSAAIGSCCKTIPTARWNCTISRTTRRNKKTWRPRTRRYSTNSPPPCALTSSAAARRRGRDLLVRSRFQRTPGRNHPLGERRKGYRVIDRRTGRDRGQAFRPAAQHHGASPGPAATTRVRTFP